MSKRPTRVLMLLENCSYPRDSRVKHEAESLVRAGYHTTVICPNQGSQPWNETISGVWVYRFRPPRAAPSALGYVWEYAYSMIMILALSILVWVRFGVDVVHAHNPPDTFFVLVPLVKLWGVRFIYDHHDLAPELYDARFGPNARLSVRGALERCEALSCRVADKIIVTNESYRAIAEQRGHAPREKVTVVRNGPDEVNISKSLLRQQTLIVYAGSMGAHDGVEYLLNAVKSLIADYGRNGFRCVLLGDGDALPSLSSLAHELGIDTFVDFRGWVEPEVVRQTLSEADICVAPEPFNAYNNRSTMIKVLEYMAAGKPIVAFDLAEHRFSAGDAAVYASPNDSKALAESINVLMDNHARREQMGRIGRQRIATEFAWHFQEQRLLEVYRNL